MNIFRTIIEALNPCIHTWDVVETLKDNLDHPTHITIVRVCSVCGEVDQQHVRQPTLPDADPRWCKDVGHKWKTLARVGVIAGQERAPGQLPTHFDHEQECVRCGELRVKRL